jgi:hypothetical protein
VWLRTVTAAVSMLGATALLAYKIWQVRSRWDNPRIWALWAAVFFFAIAQLLSVPDSSVWLGEVTGIPNLARPLTYCTACATAASFLTLALVWRYPPRSAWPKVRWVLSIYGLIIVLIIALFVMSTVPEERPLDFPTYYAEQATVTTLMLVFLSSAITAFAILGYWCFTWANSDDFAELPWLRRGLRLYGAVGVAFTCWLTLVLTVTVASNFFGTSDLGTVYRLSVDVFSVTTIVLLIAALVVPVWGPRWPAMRNWIHHWHAFLTLRPLHRGLRPIAPNSVIVARGKRLNPHHRVRRMIIELNDWRTTLTPLFTPETRHTAETHAHHHGLTGAQLEAHIEATQLHTATHHWNHGHRTPTTTPPDDEHTRDGTGTIDTELTWWLRVARAYRHHTPPTPTTTTHTHTG